jgi:sirohydrochlorin cobaltochelatase
MPSVRDPAWHLAHFQPILPPVTATHPDAALVLVGHGSTLNAESALPTLRHADELRRRRSFGQVLACFWKEEPSIAGILRGVWKPRVFVVPVFVGEGYFTEEIIPRELGLRAPGADSFERVQTIGGRRIHYCGPVGTHDSMTAVVESRALDAVARDPGGASPPSPAELSLFVAGHGTSRNENSRRAIERHVERLRAAGRFHDVHAVFMEEEPRIADCRTIAGTPNLVVVPFFVSDGLHSQEDIPVLLGESETVVRERLQAGESTWHNPRAFGQQRVWYTRSIGDEPHIPDVILERVAEIAGT